MVMIGSAHQKPRPVESSSTAAPDRTEHVAGAVAEVHDAEDTEDHGQPQRGQRVEAAQGQALERVLDEGGHGVFPWWWSLPCGGGMPPARASGRHTSLWWLAQ